MTDPVSHIPDAPSEPEEDSEVDYRDDDRGSDQLPQDVVASIEAGTILDDPEELAAEDDTDDPAE